MRKALVGVLVASVVLVGALIWYLRPAVHWRVIRSALGYNAVADAAAAILAGFEKPLPCSL